MKKNKTFTVDDFIIFVRAKILIIFLFTSLITSITIYFQSNYNDYWKVELSRNVNKNSLLKAVQIINDNLKKDARKFGETPSRINTLELLMNIESMEEQVLTGYLTAEGFDYSDTGDTKKRHLLKEKIYNLTIYNQIKKLNKKDLEKKIDHVISDTNKFITEILEVQYETDELRDLKFFKFKILNLNEIIGYEYSKILKVILIYFTAFTLIFFLYDRRKSINLF